MLGTNPRIKIEVMKTAEEILSKHNPFQNNNGNTEYFTQNIIDAMEEYANQSKWISVDERLPEDEEECIITNGIVVEVAQMYGGEFCVIYDLKAAIINDVTHWQPLPNPPTK